MMFITRKKLLGILTLVLMLAGLVPATASAQPTHIDTITSNSSHAGISGDGTWIAWHLGQFSDLHLKNLETGVYTAVDIYTSLGYPDLEFPNVVTPALNQDGSIIALMTGRPDGDGSGRQHRALFVIEASGNELAHMTAQDYYGDAARFREDFYFDSSGRYALVTALDYIRTLNSVTPGGTGRLIVSGDISNVYRLDVQTGEISLVSVDSSGREANDNSTALGISEGGRYALFETDASSLPGANGEYQLYMRDMSSTTGAVTQISVDPDGATFEAAQGCAGNCISNDGNRVVFNGFKDGSWRAYLWERGSGVTELTRLADHSGMQLSGDGRWIAAEGVPFTRWNLDTDSIDPTTLDLEDILMSDNGSRLVFQEDSLNPPPGEEGPWWMLSFDNPPPADISPPQWPVSANLVLTPSAGNVGLSWPAATDDTGVTEYIIFRNDSELASVAAPDTAWTDVAVPVGTHDYVVQAKDAADNSSTDGPGNSIVIAPVDSTPPAWPGGQLTGTQSGALGVQLNWTAAIDTSGVKEYVLYRGGVETYRGNQRSFAELVPKPGTYSYHVEAVDLVGNQSTNGPSIEVAVLPPPITVSVSESITVSDLVNVPPSLLIEITEVITVSDEERLLPALTITVEELITVSDGSVMAEVEVASDKINLTLPEGPLFPGSVLVASAGGFKPLTLVQAFLQSDPVLVGEKNADENGAVSFTITIPIDFPPGPHHVVLVGEAPDGSERRLSAPIFVNALIDGVGPLHPVPGPTLGHWSLWILLSLVLATGWAAMRRQ